MRPTMPIQSKRKGLIIDLNNGYVFLAEMKYRAFRKKLRIKEVPIVFVERRLGVSKMSGNIMIEGVLSVLRMRFRR